LIRRLRGKNSETIKFKNKSYFRNSLLMFSVSSEEEAEEVGITGNKRNEK
jgi:hypothetical protein